MKKLIFLIFIFVWTGISVYAQDIHFSQFNRSPFNLNPALTGFFDGDYRIVANQRTQWNSVTTPYSTFGIAGDARNVFNKENINGGLSIFNDKAGDSHLSTFKFNFSGSYTYALKKDSSQFLNFGLITGVTSRTIDYDDLSFDNQYVGGAYVTSAGHGETFQRDGRAYLNLATGVNWSYLIDDDNKVHAGMALYNITKPKQTYYSDNSIRLDRRFNIHAGGEIKLDEDIDLLPGLLFMSQGKFKEIVFGSEGRMVLNDVPGNYRALFAGLWYRNRDAGYISAGMEYNNITVGVSYDINVSNLVPASRYRGGLEFSLIYIIKQYKPDIKRYKACPDYI